MGGKLCNGAEKWGRGKHKWIGKWGGEQASGEDGKVGGNLSKLTSIKRAI